MQLQRYAALDDPPVADAIRERQPFRVELPWPILGLWTDWPETDLLSKRDHLAVLQSGVPIYAVLAYMHLPIVWWGDDGWHRIRDLDQLPESLRYCAPCPLDEVVEKVWRMLPPVAVEASTRCQSGTRSRLRRLVGARS